MSLDSIFLVGFQKVSIGASRRKLVLPKVLDKNTSMSLLAGVPS